MQPLTQEKLDVIATYMYDDIREKVHSELAPCAPKDFLEKYVEYDPCFADVLKIEFSIEL